MTKLIYDGSFEGLLTALFEAIEYRYTDVEIIEEYHYLEDLFSEKHQVISQPDKAKRIMDFFHKKLGKKDLIILFKLYLSENYRKNLLLLELLKKCMKSSNPKLLNDLADLYILEISKIVQSVNRESHRMKAFVRFQRMQNEYYFAEIEPDFNVLPLIKIFFTKRYADQNWIIFDVKRNYAMIYDKTETHFFYPNEEQLRNFKNIKNQLHNSEKLYQSLWKSYFEKTNIKERKNLKLHYQQLPKRYWKYLTEKF